MTCGDSEQWLLDCLNGPAPIPREPIEQFGESQWQALVNAAARHGLRPLLYERLATPSDSLKIPEAVLRELRESYLKNGLRNQLLYRDLARVLGELREDGIPVIVLKGAHLAALVYPRMALRVMGDIDLLVKRADLKQAASRLRQLGYAFETEVNIEAFLTGFPPPAHLPPLFKPPHPRIELHWRIDPAQPLQEELDLWQRARPARLAGADTLVLAPEDLVLHLCLHGGSHHLLELGLRPLCDLRVTLEQWHAAIDWPLLLSLARRWRVEQCVYLMLSLARELVQAPLPERILQSLKPAGFEEQWLTVAKECLRQAENGFDSETAALLKSLGLLTNFCAPHPLLSGHRSRWRAVFPSRAYMTRYMAERHSLPLTPVRAFTCYATRIVDWIRKGFRLAWFLIIHCRQAPRYLRDRQNQSLLRKWLT